ncbi:PKD domain-containing protein [Streptomyces sp. NPDC058662]|uniref:PKD domain-containing protein n=1 Tax=Streptomyces sp. NPDC058662 TaxID=3346583 RepID=UPI003650A068
MRATRTTVLLTAGLVTLLGLPASAVAAETPSSLYVNNSDGAGCSDAGLGSAAAPFCTIGAAAKVVRPGQTVRIKPGKAYAESLTIARSGEPGKPIAFVADGPKPSDRVELGAERALTVSGASHVVLRGLRVDGGARITGSTAVELDRSFVSGPKTDSVSLVVDGGSADVRVTRSTLDTTAQVQGGARNTVFSRNMLFGYPAAAVVASDAPGTVVTNNDVHLECDSALSFGGASTGSAVFNNRIRLNMSVACPAGPEGKRRGVVVSQSAVAGTRADYNLVTDVAAAGRVAYQWAGVDHTTQAAFTAASGQGAHDILRESFWGTFHYNPGSPTVDSGDPTAPGVLDSDIEGMPVTDDPTAANTGRGGGHIDRGAYESRDSWVASVMLGVDEPWAPAGTAVKATASVKTHWGKPVSYTYDFGDGTAPVTSAGAAEHVYASPCECVVKVTAASGVMRAVAEKSVKVTAATPLSAGFTWRQQLPTAEEPSAYVAPLTAEIDPRTASKTPWPVQYLTVDFGDGTSEARSGLEVVPHVYGKPGEYKVSVTVLDVKGGTSTVSQTVKVAYRPSGFVAVAPKRVLDTRSPYKPVQGGTAVLVDVPIVVEGSGGYHSGGASAAVLNVTVTGATEDTHLSVWPSGQPRPVTSNVNVRAGGTSSNTVTVPLGVASSVLAQLNSGTASVIVDFVGYYRPNAGERFTPIAPTRLADTRVSGAPLTHVQAVKVAGVNGIPADASAVALNLTSTGSTENSHVIAYADRLERPSTSNLNPEPGKDKSNQAIVPVGSDGTILLYTNTGSTHLIVDAVGYYTKSGKALFTPVVPQRLGDTRATGKLSPGATATVGGVPAGAVGAALNVTATESTGAGFLTVFAQGGARPTASSLQTRVGETIPNHVTSPVNAGRVDVWNSYGGSTHVITDLLGYFAP